MKIYTSKTKQESRNLINKLKLNTVPEIFVDKEDFNKVKDFMDNNPCDFYCIRDAEHSSSKYYYVNNYEEYVSKVHLFPHKAIVAVSLNAYKNKLLLGAIKVDGDEVIISCTTNPIYDHRTMYKDLDFDYKTNIFDEKLSKIPFFDTLYKYIYDNQIEGLFIEFTIYDRNVGSNKEKILISELRDY